MCFQRPRKRQDCVSSHLDIQLIDTTRQLPSDFAIRLIEREMNLEKTWEKSAVEDLIALYSVAIEHYSSKDDEKAVDFQMRMQKMLRRPEVLRAYSTNSVVQQKELIEDSEETRVESVEVEEIVIEEAPKQAIQAEEAVKDKELSDKVTGDKLIESMKSQESELESRLTKRRHTRAVSTASFCFSPVSEIDSPKSVKNEYIESEIEELMQRIMEKNYEEKANKISEIALKYNTEISSMEDSGMMAMVIGQLKQNMKNEIDSINQEFDDKRRNELKLFKAEYLSNRAKCSSP